MRHEYMRKLLGQTKMEKEIQFGVYEELINKKLQIYYFFLFLRYFLTVWVKLKLNMVLGYKRKGWCREKPLLLITITRYKKKNRKNNIIITSLKK